MVMKRAIRSGFLRKGADIDLSGIPEELLIDMVRNTYSVEFKDAVTGWLEAALRREGASDDAGDAREKAHALLMIRQARAAERMVGGSWVGHD